MTNRPAGHQHSLMPAISRSSPAFEPSKASSRAAVLETCALVASAIDWSFRTHPATNNSPVKSSNFMSFLVGLWFLDDHNVVHLIETRNYLCCLPGSV